MKNKGRQRKGDEKAWKTGKKDGKEAKVNKKVTKNSAGTCRTELK